MSKTFNTPEGKLTVSMHRAPLPGNDDGACIGPFKVYLQTYSNTAIAEMSRSKVLELISTLQAYQARCDHRNEYVADPSAPERGTTEDP